MSTILLLGASGYLGRNLLHYWKDTAGVEVYAFSRNPTKELEQSFKAQWLDFSQWETTLNTASQKDQNVCLINAVAMAELPACEKDPQIADQTNHLLAVQIATACKANKISFVQISTDGLFSNEDNDHAPHYWPLTDEPDPQTVYGHAKLAAEEGIKALNWGHVLRLSFVGKDLGTGRGLIAFYKTQLQKPNPEITGYTDNWFTPLHTESLSRSLLKLAAGSPPGYSLRHWSSYPALNKFQFAEQVCKLAKVSPKLIPAKRGDLPGTYALDQSLRCDTPWAMDEVVKLTARDLAEELSTKV